MSEPTIPDCCACGCSGETQQSRRSEWIYWTCGGWQHIESGKFGVNGKENRDTHMALIRSLREELAETNNILRSECREVEMLQGQLAEARDAERDQIADWLQLCAYKTREELTAAGMITASQVDRIDGEVVALEHAAQALRNNEHRSNT